MVKHNDAIIYILDNPPTTLTNNKTYLHIKSAVIFDKQGFI